MEFEYLDNSQDIIFGGIFAGTFVFIAIISLAFVVLNLIANWKLFEKAGIQGWKSLIPFYNFYKRTQVVYGNDGGILVLIYLIPLANVVFALYTQYKYVKVYKGSTVLAVLGLFFQSIINLIIGFGKEYIYIGPYISDIYRDYREYNNNNYNQGFNNNNPNFSSNPKNDREEYDNRYNNDNNTGNMNR